MEGKKKRAITSIDVADMKKESERERKRVKEREKESERESGRRRKENGDGKCCSSFRESSSVETNEFTLSLLTLTQSLVGRRRQDFR